MGKVQKNPSDGFPKILRVKQKCVDFPKHGKIEFPFCGKSIGKQKHSKILTFLNILGEVEIRKIPKIWQK